MIYKHTVYCRLRETEIKHLPHMTFVELFPLETSRIWKYNFHTEVNKLWGEGESTFTRHSCPHLYPLSNSLYYLGFMPFSTLFQLYNDIRIPG